MSTGSWERASGSNSDWTMLFDLERPRQDHSLPDHCAGAGRTMCPEFTCIRVITGK